MRILQLVQKPQRRGAEVFAYELSDWLRARGNEVHTFYLYGYDGPKPLTLIPGDVSGQAREDHPFERFPLVQPALLQRLRGEMRSFRPEIVQMNGARTVKYGSVAKACEHRPAWKLVYRNIDSPLFWLRGALRRRLYRHGIMSRVDGVVGVSQRTLDEVHQLYQLRVPHTFIPNGVDFGKLGDPGDPAAIRENLQTPDNAVVALFMGSLTAQKRPDRFLRVLAKCVEAAPNLYGWLLGDGPDRVELERQVAALGLERRVRFLGYQEGVAPFINAADFYLSTSDTEGIPAVVLEVGYLGKSAVAMRVGGMHECIRDGSTGLLVEAGDEAGLARAVSALAQDADRRRAMGDEARAWIAEQFSIGSVGQQYLQFYKDLLAPNVNRASGARRQRESSVS